MYIAPQLSGSNQVKIVNVDQEHKKNESDWDEKSFASQSHSILRDLPTFPKESKKEKSTMKKNKSAPSLSSMQQHKLESGLYLHESQIPRSLSAGFADYQPDMALSLLMDLPMEAYMGIGGGSKQIKSLLQKALKQVNEDIKTMDENADTEDEEDLRIDSSVNQSQAIPTAPDAIPPDAIINEADLSSNKDRDIDINDDDNINVEILANGTTTTTTTDLPRIGSRAHAESVKHDLEQTLKQGYTRNLIIAVIQALVGAFLYGWNVAILNVPQPVVQNKVTNMSDTEYALLATMFCAGGLIGALAAGPLQDRIGRKKALLLVDIIFILSSALTFGYAMKWLGPIDKTGGYIIFWIGRFLVGIACGAATAVVPTYLGEIAPPLIRGAIGTSNQLTICFGVVIVELVGGKPILGNDKAWPYLFIGNALPIIQILTAFTFPESPKWLCQQGRDSEARKALQILRMTKDVRIDMRLMKGGMAHEQNAFHSPHVSPKMKRRNFNNNNNNNNNNAGNNDGTKNEPLLNDVQYPAINSNEEGAVASINQNPTRVNDDILSRSVQGELGRFGMQQEMWKAVKWATIIAIVLMFMQQFSGINAVFYYSTTILNNAGLTNDTAVWLGSVAISVANFLAVFIAVFSIDRAGRKLLLILSCIIMGSASVLVSIAIELENHGAFWQYSSIAFLILFVIGFEVGLGAIPWLMMAELAPMQYRGAIVAIATASNWGSNLLIAQFSGVLVGSVKFYPFAAVCFVSILFTMRYIPETNGKTAAEIQRELINM